MRVLLKYDGCSQFSHCSEAVLNFINEPGENVHFTLNQLCDNRQVDGSKVGVSIEMFNNGQPYLQSIELVGSESTDSFNTIDRLYIPEFWQSHYNLQPEYYTAEGVFDVLFGLDLTWLSPLFLAQH